MDENRIKTYLRALQRELRARGLSGAETAECLEEIESHLRESIEGGLRQGLSLDEAQQQSLLRFGPVKTIAVQFENERSYPMQKVLFILALLAGLLIAYIDSRPTWDDTGITVLSLLLSSGLLSLLGFRRPWLLALAVGLWLPLWYIYSAHRFDMLITLIFPLVGAYAGWGVRLVVRKARRTA